VADILIGVAKEAQSTEAAHAEWQDTFPGENPPGLLATQDFRGDFVPSEEGYPVRLLDGIMSRLRFRRDAGEATGFMPEWRVANRSFTVPPEFALGPAVKRVTDYFASPHMNLEFSEDAAQWHTSYQGGLNVQSHVAREKGDTMSGARMGAAPWQIGVLSGCLLVYEIFAGVYSAEQLEARSLRITADHLKRAFALMKIAGSSVVLHCRQIRVLRGTPWKKQRACMQVFPLAVRTCFAHQHLFPIFGFH
jgi:hypothetical protein